MKILILEPYFTGSHAAWAKGYQKYSRHDIDILSLSGQFWKWRMHGGAITLAEKYLKSKMKPNLILVTDMLDLTTFLALTRNRSQNIPTAIYFHENQLCYPWSPEDRDVLNKRDIHYGFINYSSALAADAVLFNSKFHCETFFHELPKMLKHFPDHRGLENIEKIKKKSQILPLGLDLKKFDQYKPNINKLNKTPLILWNHRWEYDKNPAEFFKALFVMAEKGLHFQVAVLGENFSQQPVEFEKAQEILGDRIIHFGYAGSFKEYTEWLWRADIIPVTSRQDFFGVSAVEAIYCGCYPLLPNRLAFPEIIPVDNYPEIFYNDFNELLDKLMKVIKDIRIIRQQNFKSAVEKYSWETMTSIYDNIMEKITVKIKR